MSADKILAGANSTKFDNDKSVWYFKRQLSDEEKKVIKEESNGEDWTGYFVRTYIFGNKNRTLVISFGGY